MDEHFLEQLLSLHRKIEFLEQSETAQSSASYRDVAPDCKH